MNDKGTGVKVFSQKLCAVSIEPINCSIKQLKFQDNLSKIISNKVILFNFRWNDAKTF